MQLRVLSAQAHSKFRAQHVYPIRSEEKLEQHAAGLRRRVRLLEILEQEQALQQGHTLGPA